MLFTPDELKSVTTLIEVGAKAISNDKPLQESAAIQATALNLLQKLQKAHEQKSQETEA